MTILAWLREDLRADDNRALLAAIAAADAAGVPVHAAWCAVPSQWDAHGMGDNRRWFLYGSVRELSATLAAAGIPLHVLDAGDFAGSTGAVLALASAVGATAIHAGEEYPLNEQRRDTAMAAACARAGVAFRLHDDTALVPPRAVLTKSGTPYTVFTPYRQSWYQALAADRDLAPRAFRAPRLAVGAHEVATVRAAAQRTLDALASRLRVAATVQAAWTPGEAAARARLDAFADGAVRDYRDRRDLPAVPGTSTLSPWLAAGCLSPRRALAAARAANRGDFAEGSAGVVTWVSELAWRDFYRQVMFHHPHVSTGRAFRRETDAIRWRRDDADFAAWCAGETGVPLVDAAMRQLVATGWMHNRLRMVVAMYLSKNLLLDWRLGEAFFARHLVDWDFAANNGGWQWSASTGTDAAPYFRLFNPVRQGERFDPDGAFVRRWLPALRAVPDRFVHAPWLLAEARGGLFDAPAGASALPAFAPPRISQDAAKQRVLAAFRALDPGARDAAAGDDEVTPTNTTRRRA